MSWLSDPEESAFTLPLLRGEAGDLAGYAAWLRGKGDPRGEILELILRCSGDVDDPAARRRIAELREHAIEEQWLGLVAPHWLLGCGEQRAMPPRVRFSYECPRTWAELAPTADPKVRSCDGCGEQVHRCASIAEAEDHARAGRCISVPSPLTTAVYKRVEHRLRMITGRPSIPGKWMDEVL